MPETLVAVANTGPLISAFQSNRVDLLQALFHSLTVPHSALSEYERHGLMDDIRHLIDSGSMKVVHLSSKEEQSAKRIAQEIANHPRSRDREADHHQVDAEVIVVAERKQLTVDVVLLDELAARGVAEERGLTVIGYPGILIRCCRIGLITPMEVREILMSCVAQGTFYTHDLIERAYSMLKDELDEQG